MIDVATIDLPFIEKNPRRSGTFRYFLRIKGERVCRLPDAIGSEEFLAEYWAARNKYEAQHAPQPQTGSLTSLTVKPASFKWLTLEYMRSDAFKLLDVTTQEKRRSIIESIWDESLKPGDARKFADLPIAKVTAGHIEILRDRKKETPFAADERLKVLRQVFETKDKDGKAITVNVAKLVRSFRKQSEGHHTATPEELKQFIDHHGVKSKQVLAISILMFTGFRISDLAHIGPQHRRKDTFKLRLFKNRNRTPVTLEIPIHPILDAVLRLHKPTGLAYIVTEFGRPFSIKSLGNRVSEWFTDAGLPHCTAHSVRKGLATDQAHNEASDSMLEAMFGWKDGKTSKIYTRNANQSRLARAAVAKIEWDGLGAEFLGEIEAAGVAEGKNG